jgi:hypothetical protein
MRRWLLGFVMLAACGGTEADAVEQPPVEIGSPPDDCTALVGSEPWITLFERKPTRRCVIVGEHQDVQIWNKGFDGLTIQWVTGQTRLGPDDHLDTGPGASVFVPGPNQIASSPYPMPIIWLLPEAASPSANIHLDGESFGPVSPGMSLSQASDALGLPIEIDPNLLPAASPL